MALEHFLERGFRNFGFFSTQKVHLRDEFVAALEASGFKCASYVVPPTSGMEPSWNLSVDRLRDWLSGLPKPAAVLAWGNGHPLIYAAQAAGLSIPEEVAVLTSYYDKVLGFGDRPDSRHRTLDLV